MLDIKTQVVGEEVNFYLNGNEYIASISLRDSLAQIREKTRILIEGCMDLVGQCKPQFNIDQVLDRNQKLRNVKLTKLGSSWYWVYEQNGKTRRSAYRPENKAGDVVYFTNLVLQQSAIPENSITAMVIRAIIETMTKEVVLK